MTNISFILKYSILDYFRRTRTLKLYESLIKSQFFEDIEIEAIQFERLKSLLYHAYNNVPYYKKKFDELSAHPADIKRFSDLSELPITSKDTVRENFEDFKSNYFKKYAPRFTQTGGTTGKPFLTYKDSISHSYNWANNFRGWNAAGYSLGDKFIHLATGSLLPNTNSIKTHIYNFLQNAVLITSYHLSEDKMEKILNVLNSSKAHFLYGYSSAIHLLAEYCNSSKTIFNSSLTAIFTTSDMLYPKQRELIEKTFNTSVFDIYGNPESGLISFECKEHDGYHYNQESSFVEILEANYGGFGKIISTPLHNYAFPLIRFETGDVGCISEEPCRCGRKLKKIKELGGRIRDFIKLEDGRYIHGAFFNHLEAFYSAKWINQYQIVQDKINELTIKISTQTDPSKVDLKRIESSLKKGLLPNIKINFDFSGVEYSASGKFRLVISNL